MLGSMLGMKPTEDSLSSSPSAPPSLKNSHIFKKGFIYLFERDSTEGEGEAGSLLSREPHVGLYSRSLRSGPELKADT